MKRVNISDTDSPPNWVDEETPFITTKEGQWDVDGPPVRVVIIITTAVFMGYASLVAWQKKLKDELGISDANAGESQVYGTAVSFLYLGNLIFRLMHNVVFFFLRPRQRVYMSMFAMGAAMFILGVLVFSLGWKGVHWVFLSYGLGGVGVGSFESNLLSSITPLGHATKQWAIIGFPLGFAIIMVGGFFLVGAGVPVWGIYLIVLFMLGVAGLMWAFVIPAPPQEGHNASIAEFVDQAKGFREWLPHIWKNAIALMLDMFFVSLFSGIMLYILDANEVSLLGPATKNKSALVSHDYFMAVYNIFTLMGDSGSRRISYKFKLISPFWYLLASFGGAALCFSTIGMLAPLGIFFVFYGNGAIYATSTKHIDLNVPKRYNLIALSVWLFVGDVGSVTGSNVLVPIRNFFCEKLIHQQPYMCVPQS